MPKIDRRRFNTPPAKHQFKPGQTGNAGGRPKKRSSFWDEVRDELDTITTVDGVKMTKQRAIAKASVALALKGNLRSIAYLIPEDGPKPEDGPGSGANQIKVVVISGDDAEL